MNVDKARLRRARWLPLLGVLVMATLVACGSDKKAAPPPTTSPLTTAQPVDTSFTGSGSGPFCELAKTISSDASNIPANASTAQVRSSLEQSDKAFQQAVDAAPNEIKADVTVMARGFSALVASIAGAGYDISKVPPDAFSAFQAPEFASAAARLQAYLTNVCHVTK